MNEPLLTKSSFQSTFSPRIILAAIRKTLTDYGRIERAGERTYDQLIEEWFEKADGQPSEWRSVVEQEIKGYQALSDNSIRKKEKNSQKEVDLKWWISSIYQQKKNWKEGKLNDSDSLESSLIHTAKVVRSYAQWAMLWEFDRELTASDTRAWWRAPKKITREEQDRYFELSWPKKIKERSLKQDIEKKGCLSVLYDLLNYEGPLENSRVGELLKKLRAREAWYRGFRLLPRKVLGRWCWRLKSELTVLIRAWEKLRLTSATSGYLVQKGLWDEKLGKALILKEGASSAPDEESPEEFDCTSVAGLKAAWEKEQTEWKELTNHYLQEIRKPYSNKDQIVWNYAETLKKRYKRSTQILHPDRKHSYGEEVVQEATESLKQLTVLYLTTIEGLVQKWGSLNEIRKRVNPNTSEDHPFDMREKRLTDESGKILDEVLKRWQQRYTTTNKQLKKEIMEEIWQVVNRNQEEIHELQRKVEILKNSINKPSPTESTDMPQEKESEQDSSLRPE